MMKYKLIITPALEASEKSIELGFETAEQMICAKDACASLLLFLQDDIKAMEDYSNIFEMEELIAGDWFEYEEV